MNKFIFRSPMPAPATDVFSWHERPGAIRRLIPPWEEAEVLHRDPGLQEGSRVHLRFRQGLVKIHWIAQHSTYVPGKSFTDVQIKGPFSSWKHLHKVESTGKLRAELEDHIEYELPGGRFINACISPLVDRKLRRTFAYRHRVIAHDIACISRYPDRAPLKFAIIGANSMVGQALVPFLQVAGHEVIRVSPRATAKEGDLIWDVDTGEVDLSQLEGLDGIIHLWIGQMPSGTWTRKKRQQIWDDRVHATRRLLKHLASLGEPPKVLVNASSMTYYGDSGDRPISEASSRGDDFLAQVYHEREQVCYELVDSRIVHLRTGLILTPKGGHLRKMMKPFQLGFGGRMGSGQQYWSWISLDDVLYQIYHTLMTEDLVGPVNLVSPYPMRNHKFARKLASALKRPCLIPMPGAFARLAIGESAEPILLSSRRGIPRQLLDSGAVFAYPDLGGALVHILGG